MPWQIVILSRLVVSEIFAPYLDKKNLSFGYPVEHIKFWQFLFCLVFSVLYALTFGFTAKTELWIIVGIGFLNSFGAYCQGRSIQISLSKTALFTQADDLISMMLGYVLLRETQFISPVIVLGIVLCFTAGSFLIPGGSNRRLIKFVLAYSVIWGVAGFLIRWAAINNITFAEFLFSWYSGTFAGTSCVFFFLRKERTDIKLPKKETLSIGILALSIWLSMVLGYWSAKLAPITIFQPIFLVGEAILPTLIGFWIFKEGGVLTNKEKMAFLLGLIGVVVICVGYN